MVNSECDHNVSGERPDARLCCSSLSGGRVLELANADDSLRCSRNPLHPSELSAPRCAAAVVAPALLCVVVPRWCGGATGGVDCVRSEVWETLV